MQISLFIIAQEVFQYSLLTYFLLLLAETAKEGLVSYFFNINILLFVVIISGILMVITHDEKITPPASIKKKRLTKGSLFFTLLLALGGAFLVFVGTYELGILSLVVAGIAAIIIFLLSFLVFTE